MLYSSGTTGHPKRVMPPLSGKQVGEAGADAYTAVFGQIFSLFAETIYNSCVPTYHAAPLRFGGIVSALGGTLVISQRFDAERRWRSTGSRTVSGCRRCSYACLSCPTPLVKGRVSSRSIQSRRDVGVDESSSVEGEGQQPDWCRCLRLRGSMRRIVGGGRSCGSSIVGDDRRRQDILGSKSEGDVVDHVLLAADQGASATFEEQVAHIDLVAFRGDLRMAKEG